MTHHYDKEYSPIAHLWAKTIEAEMAMIDDVPESCLDDVLEILNEKKATQKGYQARKGYPMAAYNKQQAMKQSRHAVRHTDPTAAYGNTQRQTMGHEPMVTARTLLASVTPSANGYDVPMHQSWISQISINRLEAALKRAEHTPTEANLKTLKTLNDKFKKSVRAGLAVD